MRTYKGLQMLSVVTINEKNIGTVEVISTEVFTDYFDREIIIHDIDKQKYLNYVNYKPIKGFEYISDLIEFKPMFRINSIPDNKYMVFITFTKPVEISIINLNQAGTFRILPDLPHIAINQYGLCYNLVTNKVLTTHDSGYYVTVTVDNNVLFLHRLVALVWCENDDYVKNYVVDHLDQDKHNYYYKNLRWLSNKANVSRSHANNKGKAVDERWWIYSSKFNKVFKFTGLKEIDKFFGIPYRNIEARAKPFLYKLPNGDVLIVEDRHNFKNFNLKKKISEFGYNYKTKNKNNGVIRYYRLLDDVLKIHVSIP